MEQYETLRAASSGDISDFSDALQSIHSADSGKGGSESEQGDSKQAESRREQEIFERMERAKLYAEWKRGELAGKLQEKIEEHALALMSSLGGAIGQLVPKILLFPMQLLTALLLSFLIT
ncbi:MAG: hypothetical protein ACK559_32515, partial [bacterium]